MMIRKLGQYGGYLLSGILIAWLINPIAAVAFLEFFLATCSLVFLEFSLADWNRGNWKLKNGNWNLKLESVN